MLFLKRLTHFIFLFCVLSVTHAALYTNVTPGAYSFTVPSDTTLVQVLLAGGGGGGGGADTRFGGNGGNGTLLTLSLYTAAAQTLSGVIGHGGMTGWNAGPAWGTACSGGGFSTISYGGYSIGGTGGNANCGISSYSTSGGGGAGGDSSTLSKSGTFIAQAAGGGGGGGGTNAATGSNGSASSTVTTTASCSASTNGSAGGSANGYDGGGGGGGGAGYSAGSGGAAQSDASGTSTGGGGAGGSCINSASSFVTSTGSTGGGAGAPYNPNQTQATQPPNVPYTYASNGSVTINDLSPRIKLIVISNGNYGAFNFTGTNGWASQTVTTTQSGGTGTAGTTSAVQTLNTITTITETIPTGYTLASVTCTGATPSSINLSTGAVSFAAASIVASANITCTFTNNKTPTLAVQKTTFGGLGTFSFTQSNLATPPANITTTTINSPAPASPTAINVTTVGTAVTLTETPATGFRITGASCTDSNSGITGNTGTFGTVASNTLTIPAANVKLGAQFRCTFTNEQIPTLTVQKTTTGGFGGPFTFTQTNLATAPGGITTTAINTPAPTSPTAINVSTTGTAVTLIESPATGFRITGASCTDANSSVTGNTGTFGTVSSNTLTIPAANVKAGAQFQCTFTNEQIPTVTVQKTTIGGLGTFTFTQTNLATAPGSITTTTINTPAPNSPTAINVSTTGAAVTLTETPATGFRLTGANCIDANNSVTGNTGTFGSLSSNTLTIPAAYVKTGAQFQCTFTNEQIPTVTVQKITNSGVGGPFSFTQSNLAATPGNITTSTAGSPAPTSPTAINVSTTGTAVTLTESTTGGFLLDTANCIDANSSVTGNSGTFVTVANNTLTIPSSNVKAGAKFNCTFTNGLPKLSINKTVTSTGPYDLGSIISYSVVATNSGTVALTNVSINDPLLTATPTTCANVAQNATCTLTGSYTVTQADVDAGQVNNTATATSTQTPTPVTVQTNTPITQTLALTLTNTANPTTVSAVGNSITYSYLATNTGNVTLTNLAITATMTTPASQANLSSSSCLSTTLAPNAHTTCTASYTVTQADLDHGSIENGATASASAPNSTLVSSSKIYSTVTVNQTPSLTLTNTASPTTVNKAGSPPITYNFVATNSGNVTLSNVDISSAMTASTHGSLTVNCTPATTLAPGATLSCSGSYIVTQADMDSGVDLVNQATATGTAPNSTLVSSSMQTSIVQVSQAPSLTLNNDPSPMTVNAAGDSIDYNFVATNNGNVTLTNVNISALMESPASPSTLPVSCTPTTLAPGATLTCTGSYTVTQADIDTGNTHPITNDATASGKDPGGTSINATKSSTVAVDQAPSLTLMDTATPTTVSHAGDSINYVFKATNNGNVTLTSVNITALMESPASPSTLPVTCTPTTLDPGATLTCTGSYTVTQADIDHGSIVNAATAAGTDPKNAEIKATDSASVTVTQTPILTLTNKASPTTVSAVGDLITYSYLATNIGNVTLSNLTINATMTAPAGNLVNLNCPSTTLAPNAYTTCTASYTVTQADLDHGSIENGATALATAPNSAAVSSSKEYSTVTVNQKLTLTLTNMASPTTVNKAGTPPITYNFVATNGGNVTLSNVDISSAMTASAQGSLTVNCTPAATLAPGATLTCSGSYVVTQADMDSGVDLVNEATATGTAPNSPPISSSMQTSIVQVSQAPSLTLSNDPSPMTVNAAGDSIDYNFVATNNGNVTLTNVNISALMESPASPSTLPVTCTPTTLAPGATLTCTGSYTVTQNDIDNGVDLVNNATASGTSPQGNPINATDSSSVKVTQTKSLTLTNSASPTTVSTVGELITYSYLATNEGNVTLTNLAITTAMMPPAANLENLVCPSSTLAPGANTTCTATYTITQDDIDNGFVVNEATASASAPNNSTVPSSTQYSTVIVAQSPSFTLTNTANKTTVSTAGEQITYNLVAINDGNVTLTDADILANMIPPASPSNLTVSCTSTTLAPGDTLSCTGTYTVSQDDIDNGSNIVNVAKAIGTDPNSNTIQAMASATVTMTQVKNLNLTNQASPTQVSTLGDVITYHYLVSNAGNVTLTNLAIDAAMTPPAGSLENLVCPSTTLAPGDTLTCTAGYTVTQADLDYGSIKNEATASTSDPSGTIIQSSTEDSSVTVTQSPSLKLTNDANPTTVSQAGNPPIIYSFTATNDGNVTLTNVEISAAMTASAQGSLLVSCTPAATLTPGATLPCTGTYTVSQGDIDNGVDLVNNASVTGKDPKGNSTQATASASVTVHQEPKLTLENQPSPTMVSAAGEQITYSYLVTNTGNLTLTNLVITANMLSPASQGSFINLSCPKTTLPPTENTTCTASYTVTQADIDHDSIMNEATASTQAPNSTTISSAKETSTVTVTQEPDLTLTNTANKMTVSTAGEQITYNLVATNNGNVTLTSVDISALMAAPASQSNLSMNCTPTTLAPGDKLTCTGTYTVSQSDIDNGVDIVNNATTTGTDPKSTAIQASASASVTVTQMKNLSLTNNASPTTVSQSGTQITYTYFASNSGNVTLTELTISANMSPPSSPDILNVVCPSTTLAPGDSTTCTASYTVTQTDIDHGTIKNEASASTSAPDQSTVVSPTLDSTVTVIQTPHLTLTNSASPTTVEQAGNPPITYSFVATNDGNVTLTNVDISAQMTLPASQSSLSVSCTPSTLAPGAILSCTGSYTVSQDDIDKGVDIVNDATATGTAPNNTATQATASASVKVAQAPKLSLVSSATPTSVNAVGDLITYNYLLNNAGNVTLTNLAIAASMTSPADQGQLSNVVCLSTTLAPGDNTTCSASYTVTQTDLDHGSIVNEATASTKAPLGNTIDSPTVSFTVAALQTTSLAITGSAAPTSVDHAGATLSYSFEVKNNSNVTLHGVAIAATMTAPATQGNLSAISCVNTILAPESTTTCTGTYTSTQADIDHDSIVTHALALGRTPQGHPISSPSIIITVAVSQSPALTVTNSPNPTVVNKAGELITYSYVVSNTGNVRLDNIAITATRTLSNQGTSITCPSTTLYPNEHTTCTGTYTVTQADIDSGSIINDASASGIDPNDDTISSSTASSTVNIIMMAALTLSKSSSAESFKSVGIALPYTYTVTNSGNLTLHSKIVISDDKIAAVQCPALPTTGLAPSATIVCTASYTTTQADVDALKVSNLAFATSGTVKSNSASLTIPYAPESGSIKLDKTANIQSFSMPGTVITYSYVITNTGKSTLYQLILTDSKIGVVKCPQTTLKMGQQINCSASYTTTIDDVKAGGVTNTATATSMTINKIKVTSAASVTVGFNPELIRAKTLSAINSYLRARAQIILANQPDKRRMMNRLSQNYKCSGAPQASITPSMGTVNLNGSISSNELCNSHDLDFWSELHAGYSWQENGLSRSQTEFNIAHLGVDFLINEALIAGVSTELDLINQVGNALGFNQASGIGWLVGPYLSVRLSQNLYLHARAAWGSSQNKINVLSLSQDSFTTRRALYNIELVGDWQFNQWRTSPSIGLSFYNEHQYNYLNPLNIIMPGQNITLGQFNAGPEISYLYVTSELKEITTSLSLQGIYNFDMNKQQRPQYNTIFDGLSGRVRFGTRIRFPSGLALAPGVQYDGLGRNQFAALQGQIQIIMPIT